MAKRTNNGNNLLRVIAFNDYQPVRVRKLLLYFWTCFFNKYGRYLCRPQRPESQQYHLPLGSPTIAFEETL